MEQIHSTKGEKGEKFHSVSVIEALEELAYPSFFETSERKAAYEYVMLWGNDEEKHQAEESKAKHPFEEDLRPS